MKKFIVIVSTFVALSLVLAGCSGKTTSTQQSKELDQMTAAQSDTINVMLYYPNVEKDMVQRVIRTIAKEDALKSVNSIAKVIVNELLAGPEKITGLTNIIPSSVSLLEDVDIDPSTGIAKINFSKSLINAFDTAEKEKLFLYSLANSLTEVKEISSIQILVEGKKVDKMKNGTSIKEPIKRDSTIIYFSENSFPNNSSTTSAPSTSSAAPTDKAASSDGDSGVVDDSMNLE